jgi:ATPase subunit of ABC transporter with duplicated ATPase domains
MSELKEYSGKPFKSISQAEVAGLDATETEGEKLSKEEAQDVLGLFETRLKDRVEKVVESKRLVDSPCSLVDGRDGTSVQMERMMRMMDQEFQSRSETNEIYIPPGPRLGDKVIEIKNLRKAFADKLLIDDLSFSLPPGGIVGIVGPNGAGKTTLFKMLMGVEAPDSGDISHGDTVQIAYVDQSRDTLDDAKTVWEEISEGQDILEVGRYQTSSRAYVGRFNFKGPDQQKHIGSLSGGERNRVHLAKRLLEILLDELSHLQGLEIEGVVISRAQDEGADHDPPLHLRAEPLGSRALIELDELPGILRAVPEMNTIVAR